ncbi:8425_t:CDS:10 [Paraglomus occultum]|uniref:8425_t:CDS:1 n=1 Tax=Paraglomus occultum TaxID=144539 RepID=A0A9N8WKL0_9GLOM|nr:8425_t:CDS:10 [Paraglomus occultum]
MEQLLEWGVTHSDPSNPAQNDGQERNFDSGIIDAILGRSDAVEIRNAVDCISDPNESLANKEIAFDNLEMLVEQIDNAIDIDNMNLWPKILSFFDFKEKSLRLYAAWVCGTAVQNNPRAQKAFVDKGGLKRLLDVLKSPEEDAEVRSKALYAVSGTIKHYPPGLAQFEKEGGYEILLNVLNTSNDLSILRKAAFLFNTLLVQDPKMVATRIEEKGLARQLIHLLKVYGPQDEDLADKILQTVIAIFRHSSKSLSTDEISELRDVLPQMRNRYGTVTLNKDEWDELENMTITPARLAAVTATSGSYQNARQKVLTLYRDWQRAAPTIVTEYHLDIPTSAVRAKIREEFEKHRYVNDLRLIDVLLFKG